MHIQIPTLSEDWTNYAEHEAYDKEIVDLLELDENKRLNHPEKQEDYLYLLRQSPDRLQGRA